MPGLKNGSAALDIRFQNLLRQLIVGELAESFVANRSRRMISWRTDAGDRIELLLRRERRPDQFPLQMIKIVDKNDSAVVLTNFTVYAAQAYPSTFPSRSLCVEAPVTALSSDLEPVPLEALYDTVQGDIEKILAEQRDSASKSKRAFRWPRKFKLTADQRDLLTTSEVDQLNHWLESLDESSASEKSTSVALDHLRQLIVTRVVEQVRIENAREREPKNLRRDIDRIPTYLTGHERWRVAERLETIGPPEVSASIQSKLIKVIVNEEATTGSRIQALDVLGELGSTEPYRILRIFDRQLQAEQNVDILTMWSSVRARFDRFTDEDVKRLRTAALDTKRSEHIRWVAIEALLLIDAAAGLEERIAEVVAGASENPLDLRRRCLFALGCAKEGRAALMKLIADIRSPLRKTALYLAETSIRPNDLEWNRCLEMTEAIAIDEQAEMSLRVKAAEIAWHGGSDRPFRDRFIRQVLLSGRAREWESTGWPYLGSRSGGQRFVPEFESLLHSKDVEIRRSAAFLFQRSCSKTLKTDERNAVLRLMKITSQDPDRAVFLSNLTVYYLLMYSEETWIASVMLPLYADIVRETKDLDRIADVVASIEMTHSPGVTVHPKYVDRKTYKDRTEGDRRKTVEKHRVDYQAVLDRLAKRYASVTND